MEILFSRPRPSGLNDRTPATGLLAAFRGAQPNSSRHARDLARVKDVLVRQHRFRLSSDDLARIDHLYNLFFEYGPGINFGTPSNQSYAGMTFSDLMVATDRQGLSGTGMQRSFLATEENYRFVRTMHQRNLVVPLVGDFAGPKAILEVGKYLGSHDTKVDVFYISNVESYLQGSEGFARFLRNIAGLPLADRSHFIRAVVRPARSSNAPYVSVSVRIADVLAAFAQGRLKSREDITAMSRFPE
jgi:hypothetical protein